MQQTRALTGLKSFGRSLLATIGTAIATVWMSKPDHSSPLHDYEAAVVAAIVASVLKGFSSFLSAQSVSVTN